MNNSETDIRLKPSAIFALIKVSPIMIFSLITTYLASRYLPALNLISLTLITYAIYRYIYIRKVIYLVTTQYIRITQGLLYKRTDTVELFRVKDYIITQPLHFQLFKLMNVELKTTDPEIPILWLRGIPQSDLIETLRQRVLDSRRHNHIIELS